MKHLKPALVAWALSAGAALAAPQGFALHDTPQPVVNVRYLTEDDCRGNMEDFRGKVTVLAETGLHPSDTTANCPL